MTAESPCYTDGSLAPDLAIVQRARREGWSDTMLRVALANESPTASNAEIDATMAAVATTGDSRERYTAFRK